MKRRKFVQSMALSSIGIPLVLKNFKFEALTEDLFSVPKSVEDRVLVMIRLNGGNDGLNTLVPVDQFDNLMIQRPNIMIPENQLLSITPTLSLHTSMTGMHDLFNDGKLSVIQNVGYPNQNRSHFQSMDIWEKGSVNPTAITGWLGRYLNAQHTSFPVDYPNTDYPDPFAISMGYENSNTCQGIISNFSIPVLNPNDSFNLYETQELNDGTYYGSHLAYLSTMISQANSYGVQVNTAASAGNSLSALYDETNDLAVQLRNVAKMISGGLKTKIYVLNIDGFDTHSSQVENGSPTTGHHANLLKKVSDAIRAFQDDIELLGISQKIAGMTFSEFGRQIASNGSVGTDHGDAAPLFLFGACLSGQVIGPNPIISDTIVPQAAVPMQIDFRDVYASILKDWFLADETEIQSIFEQPVNFIPLLRACNLEVNESKKESDISVFPNPCGDKTTVKFSCNGERVTVLVHDLAGKKIGVFCDKNLSVGEHLVPISLEGQESGSYVVTVYKNSGTFTKRFTKVKSI